MVADTNSTPAPTQAAHYPSESQDAASASSVFGSILPAAASAVVAPSPLSHEHASPPGTGSVPSPGVLDSHALANRRAIRRRGRAVNDTVYLQLKVCRCNTRETRGKRKKESGGKDENVYHAPLWLAQLRQNAEHLTH